MWRFDSRQVNLSSFLVFLALPLFLFFIIFLYFFCFHVSIFSFFLTFFLVSFQACFCLFFFLSVLVSICLLVSPFGSLFERFVCAVACSLFCVSFGLVVSLFPKSLPFCFLSLPCLHCCVQNTAGCSESRFFAWTFRSCVLFWLFFFR